MHTYLSKINQEIYNLLLQASLPFGCQTDGDNCFFNKRKGTIFDPKIKPVCSESTRHLLLLLVWLAPFTATLSYYLHCSLSPFTSHPLISLSPFTPTPLHRAWDCNPFSLLITLIIPPRHSLPLLPY